MDCHGGAALAHGLTANTAGMGMQQHGQMGPGHEDADMMAGHFGAMEMGGEGMMHPPPPPEAMCDPEWAAGFLADPANMMAQQHHHEAMMMEAEFAAQQQQQQELDEMHMQEHWAGAEQHQEAQAMEAAFSAAEAPSEWADQFQNLEGENWAQDFNEEGVQVFTVDGQPVKSYEEKMQESKFYDFMNKIKSGEVVIEEHNKGTEQFTGEAAEFLNEFANSAPAEEWAAEHLDGLNGLGAVGEEAEFEGAWNGNEEAEAFNDAWGEAQNMDDFSAEFLAQDGEMLNNDPDHWAEEFANIQQQFQEAQDATDYPFDPNNPYLFHDNPFSEGVDLLAAGTVSEAVLAFEAACQKDTTQARFWQTLGTTQAENEKDQLAIKALNKARELEPANLAVHMALSVSHTNEGNHTQALRALRDWIRAHPEHEAICGFMEGMHGVGGMAPEATINDETIEPLVRDFMFISPSEHREVCGLYDAAIEMNPQDAELHIGLGILRNLSHEYDKAALSFEQALKVRPNDAKLWNKFGATLANGNRSREALAAYDRALDINPGYVRAQYNLGVSHSNLGEHELAVRQFLRAIVMQQGGVACDGEPGSNRSTRELWDVLRMTLNLMERPDLVGLAWKQDCRPFLDEFGLQELAQ